MRYSYNSRYSNEDMLELAIKTSDIDLVRRYSQKCKGKKYLIQAIKTGSVEIFIYLRGIWPDLCDKMSVCQFTRHIRKGDISMLKCILNNSIFSNINRKDSIVDRMIDCVDIAPSGVSYTDIAAAKGDIVVYKYYMKLGMKPTIADMVYAAYNNRLKMVQYLVNEHSLLDIDKKAENIAHIMGHTRIVNFLRFYEDV